MPKLFLQPVTAVYFVSYLLLDFPSNQLQGLNLRFDM